MKLKNIKISRGWLAQGEYTHFIKCLCEGTSIRYREDAGIFSCWGKSNMRKFESSKIISLVFNSGATYWQQAVAAIFLEWKGMSIA